MGLELSLIEYVVMKSPDACVLCLPLARWTEFIGLL